MTCSKRPILLQASRLSLLALLSVVLARHGYTEIILVTLSEYFRGHAKSVCGD